MSFLLGKILKLRELEVLDNKINELLTDENRTSNTDSVSRLFYERKCKIRELMHIFIAEEQTFAQPSPGYGRIMIGLQDQHAGNVHEDEENVI